MGANEWRHAPSLKKVSNDTLTLFLDQHPSPQLVLKKPGALRAARMEVDLRDRTTQHHYYYNFRTIWDSLFDGGGVMYLSGPMEKETIWRVKPRV